MSATDPTIFASHFSAPSRQRAVPLAIQVLGYLASIALLLVWLASTFIAIYQI